MVPSRVIIAGLIALSTSPIVQAIPPLGTIGMKYERRTFSTADCPHLQRRQSGTVRADLDNKISLYLINTTVGTPPQPFGMQLDTGSSDVWVPSKEANVCQEDAEEYCHWGMYDASASSTFQKLDNMGVLEIDYGDGTEAKGTYISDNLRIGDAKVPNLTMGSVTNLNAIGIGIMGLGFPSNEAINRQSGSTYPTIIEAMHSAGIIKSKSFSLWLDDVDDDFGSILFGGVDSDKYQGDLISVPIQLDSLSGAYTSFTVAFTGLKVTGGGNDVDLSPSSPIAAILDSGTTDMLLPDDIANAIFNGIGAATVPDIGNVAPCDRAWENLTFTFTFGGEGGPAIAVPMSEIVVPIMTIDGSVWKFKDGTDGCQVTIEGIGKDQVILGDSFLRSAYVVYDLDNNQIALAQTNFDGEPSDGNVEVISAGKIPGVSATVLGATVAQTLRSISYSDGDATATDGDGGSLVTSRSATFKITGSPTPTSSGGGGTATARNVAGIIAGHGSVGWKGLLVSSIVMLGVMFGSGAMLL